MCYFVKLKSRIAYSAAIGVFAILAFACGLYFRGTVLSDFISGCYVGTGSGLLAISIVYIIRNNRLLKNEAVRKKAEIEENDERNQFIASKTGYLTCMIMMMLLYISMLIAGFFNITVFLTLLCATALMIIVLLVTNVVIKKKY